MSFAVVAGPDLPGLDAPRVHCAVRVLAGNHHRRFQILRIHLRTLPFESPDGHDVTQRQWHLKFAMRKSIDRSTFVEARQDFNLHCVALVRPSLTPQPRVCMCSLSAPEGGY